MYKLSQEGAEDKAEVEALFDTCFAPGREALSSYRLREGISPVHDLCRVARDELDILAGAVRFWPVNVGKAEVLFLGPIAVHPTRQGEGLGSILIEDGLQRAQNAGWKRVLLVGDAPYYARFGFKVLSDVLMPPPTNPARVLGHGNWSGVSGNATRWNAT